MIKWLQRTPATDRDAPVEKTPVLAATPSVFERFKQSLKKTREHFGVGLANILLGKKSLDAELFQEIETLLLQADLGVHTTEQVLADINTQMAKRQLTDGDAVYAAITTHLEEILVRETKPLVINKPEKGPFVLLVVGVNGVGKTTTIGKLAKRFQSEGKSVMLAAGDTFRAAAIEQLQIWGARNQVPVIAQRSGADSASVSYDALSAAIARNTDVLIIDTAGRLHTQHNLMEELKKIKRVLHKLDVNAPHETLLILDASIGQNALNQAREFNQAIGLTGIAMTKLDGSAKGGIVFAIANELGIPFRYIGVGEAVDDLRTFEPSQFVKALFHDD